MKEFYFCGSTIHEQREQLSAHLGPLELEVMELVWQQGEASVRAIHLAFSERLAYTTLMTTLDRIAQKRAVGTAQGRARLHLFASFLAGGI
jgi:predicted transcriptional regulator